MSSVLVPNQISLIVNSNPADGAKNLSAEVFIDDMIVICLDVESLIGKATNAIPLILDAIFRPIFKETVKRLPILNRIKIMAEGHLEEIKQS